MSSRSIGVTNVVFSRWMMSWVMRSPSCSALSRSRPRPLSSGHSWNMSRSSLDERSVFWPASVKRSKKTRSCGTSENRATGGEPSRAFGRRACRPALRRPARVVPWSVGRAAPSARAAGCVAACRSAASRVQRPSLPELPGIGVVGEGAIEHVAELVLQRRVLDRRDQLDAVVEVARHQVGRADVDVRARRRARSEKIRECSRKRPTIETTWMFSETPGTPGRSAQIPRTLSSTWTPACEAR